MLHVTAVRGHQTNRNNTPSTPRIGDASFLVPARRDEPELLDLGEGTPAEVRASLYEVWRMNRLFGGVRALNLHLLPRLRQASTPHADPVTVVDIGTGAAHYPAFLLRWAAKTGVQLRVYGLDCAPRNLEIAREQVAPSSLLLADALALPFAACSVDYFVSSLCLHHFPPRTVVALLREMYRLSYRGLVMSDIMRGTLPLAAFRAAQPFVSRSELTRRDGVTSIRRAYTPAELLELAHAAGLKNARVYRHPLWRMTLVADKRRV